MRGLSATDDDILRRTFVISVSASGNFLWFLLCLERSCGRCVCLPVPTCGHAILCVPPCLGQVSTTTASVRHLVTESTKGHCLPAWTMATAPTLLPPVTVERLRAALCLCLCCLVVLLPLKRKQHPETPSLSTPDSGPGSRVTINGLLTRVIIALHMLPSQSRRRLLRQRLTWNSGTTNSSYQRHNRSRP